ELLCVASVNKNKKGGRRPYLDQVADCRSARSSAPRWHENRRAKRVSRTTKMNRFLFERKKSDQSVARTMRAVEKHHRGRNPPACVAASKQLCRMPTGSV